MRPAQQEFIKGIESLTYHGRERASRILERWAEMAYCALAKPGALLLGDQAAADALEARYMTHAKVLGKEGANVCAQLLGLLVAELDASDGQDFLGHVSMELNALHEGAGQFFTPWEVSRMMAHMLLGDVHALLQDKRYITIAEPACGAGVMMLACVEVLREKGVDIHRQVWWDATDIVPLAQHMAFIQMGLVGCSGVVRCGDTLRAEYRETALLPMSMHFIARNGLPKFEHHERTEPLAVIDVPSGPFFGGKAAKGRKAKHQLSLFGEAL